jgi:hypothetical protein
MKFYEFIQNFIIYGWLVPSIILTIHTLTTIVYISLTSIGKSVPRIISISSLLYTTEPFGRKLFEKPPTSEMFCYLVFGLLPVAPIVILVTYAFTLFIQLIIHSEDLERL